MSLCKCVWLPCQVLGSGHISLLRAGVRGWGNLGRLACTVLPHCSLPSCCRYLRNPEEEVNSSQRFTGVIKRGSTLQRKRRKGSNHRTDGAWGEGSTSCRGAEPRGGRDSESMRRGSAPSCQGAESMRSRGSRHQIHRLGLLSALRLLTGRRRHRTLFFINVSHFGAPFPSGSWRQISFLPGITSYF